MAWLPVCRSEDLPPGTVRPVDPATPTDVEIVVWRTESGAVVACDARCPHQWSHLGYEGSVEGAELVCTAHHWRFTTAGSGAKVNVLGRRDAKADVAVHPVRERDGMVEVDLAPGR